MVQIATRETWQTFLVSRFTRIYPPYWFYLALVFVVAAIAPHLVNSSETDVHPSLLRSIFLFPDVTHPLLAVGWTLVLEMYFYVVFALFLATTGAKYMALIAWGATIVIARSLLPPLDQSSTPVLYHVLHPMTLEFIAGACAGLLVRSQVARSQAPGRLGTLAFVAGLAILAVVIATNPNGELFVRSWPWARVIAVGAPMILIVYGITIGRGLKRKTDTKRPLLVTLGDASYSTYLSHVLVLSAVGRCFAIFPWHNLISEIAFVALSVVVANAWGVVSFRIIEQPSLRYLRDLFSGWRQSAIAGPRACSERVD